MLDEEVMIEGERTQAVTVTLETGKRSKVIRTVYILPRHNKFINNFYRKRVRISYYTEIR